MLLFMRYLLKWPRQHWRLRLNSSASVSMIGSFPDPVMCEGWGHEVRSVFLPSDQNYQPVHFLFCFFFLFFSSFSRDICFLLPLTWMATISYISQLLCLFVGCVDNGAVFLNAQVVSLSLSPFSHSPPLPHLSTHSLTSRSTSPPPPPPPPRPASHLYSPHLTVSLSSPLPYFISLSSFLPLYLAISLTSWPFLSHLSLLHWFCRQQRDWAQKHPIHHPTLHPP